MIFRHPSAESYRARARRFKTFARARDDSRPSRVDRAREIESSNVRASVRLESRAARARDDVCGRRSTRATPRRGDGDARRDARAGTEFGRVRLRVASQGVSVGVCPWVVTVSPRSRRRGRDGRPGRRPGRRRRRFRRRLGGVSRTGFAWNRNVAATGRSDPWCSRSLDRRPGRWSCRTPVDRI